VSPAAERYIQLCKQYWNEEAPDHISEQLDFLWYKEMTSEDHDIARVRLENYHNE
jgi:hypothetical protein